MKRLLLPLLAALALPTAVNANWLSGDLVFTNSVGEKPIIKKGTIRLEKLTLNEKYKNLKKKVVNGLREKNPNMLNALIELMINMR